MTRVARTRVLIIDDSPTQAERLRLILEAAEFTVTAARTGEEALAIIGKGGIDAVVSDVVMPRLTGFELCRRLKEDLRSAHIPVILLTTLNSPADILQALECGADNFLIKPADPALLVQRLRDLASTRSSGKTPGGNAQIMNLLVSTVEETTRVNRALQAREAELEAARRKLEEYARVQAGRATLSEGKYRSLMEQAHDAIAIADRNGVIVEVNREAEILFKVPRSAIVGRLYLELVPSEEEGRARELFAELLGRGLVKVDAFPLKQGDGGRVLADLSASVVQLAGDPVLMIIARDITERRLLEQQFLEAQKMEAVGQLAGGIAHDFNNLLTVIDGYASFLLEDQEGGEAWRDGVVQIQKAVDRAAALTRQLLAFGRRQVLAPRNLDLNTVLNDMSGLIRLLLGEGVRLVPVPAAGLPAVHADSGQLEQVIMNLVTNARDAMPKGGRLTLATGVVELGEEEARAAGGLSPGRFVSLTVSDTGIGMAPDVKARIFEPFFTTKEKGRGTGLGLSTAYGIIRQSGGRLSVESEPGRGAAFKILLPAVTGRPAEQTGRPERTPPPQGKETILLVEDESAIRDLVSRTLGRQGYRVVATEDAETAVKAAREGMVHLVITDVVMPGMSGPELVSQLSGFVAGLKGLYMSGYAQAGIVQHGTMESGFAFIQKPFTPDALARKVREVLDSPSPAS